MVKLSRVGLRLHVLLSERRLRRRGDKGRICLYMKLCDLILLSMILQLE
jgi:hypothetical protein